MKKNTNTKENKSCTIDLICNSKKCPTLKQISVQLVDLKRIIKIQTNAETLHFTANTVEKLKKIELEMKSCGGKFRKSQIEGNLVNYKSYIWYVPQIQNRDVEILKYDRMKDDLEDDTEKYDFFSSKTSKASESRQS
ncbi:hypothetical protein BpHYR1_047548 [Brachionus plicatilis]|uniref:Uncharacterized protein n=1 Tax=Brachionus plicatilis TaxID=10195 RepID=A0A3M7P5R6_BRAPC|nr:hypothetical protein BpHYR1_047548 [Brachionus plicatilis]